MKKQGPLKLEKEMMLMTNEEKIQCYRQKTIEELKEILNDPNSTESDIVIASMELADKEDELGIAVYYTTEEVMEHIFGKTKLVENS